jgi:hypothetical protein
MPVGVQPIWHSPSPRAVAPRCDPYKVTPGNWHRFTIVSSHIWAIWTHYIPARNEMKGRTQPCTDRSGDKCWCDHAKRGAGRWQAWLCVDVVGDPYPRLVCLTPKASQCDPRFEDLAYNLRGHKLGLRRMDTKRNGQMEAAIGDRVPEGYKLHDEPPMRTVIMRMYEACDRPAGDNGFHAMGNMGAIFRHLQDEGRSTNESPR